MHLLLAVRRESITLLSGMITALGRHGMVSGDGRVNLDFHAVVLSTATGATEAHG